jgi:DNA-binding IclR family transcriptional regulator
MELVRQGDPLLAAIAEDTSETAFVVVADGNEALCLRRFDGSHQIRVLYLEPGRHSAFNCGAAQRVLLAYLPDARWEEVVSGHVRRLTQYSLVSRDELERDRREIRERGYSVSWEDVTLHACALGAPVRDADGGVIAAVSISGIVQRFSAERLPLLIRSVMKLGDDLSLRLGYQPQDSRAVPRYPRSLSGCSNRSRILLKKRADGAPSSMRWSVVSERVSMRRFTTWSW